MRKNRRVAGGRLASSASVMSEVETGTDSPDASSHGLSPADAPDTIRLEPVTLLWAMAAMLLVSGGCSLIFQVVWIRELRLIFGGTTASSAAVLAIFMAGLGLGNALLGRRVDNSPRPLRLYAVLEAGIALSAGISPILIEGVQWVYVGLGGQSALGPGPATATRLLLSAAVLAIPTLLMGGTLPAAARAVSTEGDIHRRGVSLLYASNTFGAVLGSGFATFALLEALGSRGALWLGCVLNFLLAATAFGVSRRTCDLAPGARRQESRSTPTGMPGQVSTQFRIVCVASGIVGFAFFLMEIVWYRMLGPLLGGTTYTFGLILCIALLGIGVGGALYSITARWLKPTLQLLSATCAVEALLIAVPFWYGDDITLWVLRQQSQVIATFVEQVGNWFEVGAFVILGPSIVAGFQFPLLIALAGSGARHVGRHVGLTFAANTTGAILGSLAGGFALLPLLTAPGVWRAVVAILVLLAVAIAMLGRQWKNPAFVVAAATSMLALLAVASIGPTAAWRHSGIGAGRAKFEGAGRNSEQFFLNRARRECIWEAEGVESSVAITATDSISFVVNGKNDGNAYGDAGTQIGFPLLGALLHKSPKTAAVIGLGTGESAGWLGDLEGMDVLDVVEIEPVITHMAELCAPMNRNVLKNPKMHLHINDAREFLCTARSGYDLIVSEPSNPYRAGVASLYTREFYESVSTRLATNGLFLQWLQGYEVDDDTVRVVLHTLRSVFPHVQVWRARVRDMILVCGNSEASFSVDVHSLEQRFRDPILREGLGRAWGVRDLEGVFAHFVCGNRTIDKFLDRDNIPPNTDDRNLLEYAFADTVGTPTRFSVETIQSQAAAADDGLPASLDPSRLEKVSRRRLAMHLHLGGAMPAEDPPSKSLRARAKAYDLYLTRRYADAAAEFKEIEADSNCPIEAMVTAHALAESGVAAPERMMKSVETNNPTEASAIRTILHWRQRRKEQAVRDASATFELLRQSPWGSTQLIDALLQVCSEAGTTDPDAAMLLFEQLKDRFSMYRMEDKRLAIRFILAEPLGARFVVEALEPLEPNVSWKGWFLESRATAYKTQQNPRADAAQRDYLQFQAWAK